MKRNIKRAITIVTMSIIAIFAIFGVIKYRDEPNSIPEPGSFFVEYIKDGEPIETRLSSDIFGETLRISVDENTRISIGIERSNDFQLTESMFTIIEDGKEAHNTNMGNIWWYLSAGQSANTTINCGTEEKPKWVNFRIETVVQ